MFNSQVLDVALGLVFVYFLLSLLCTTLNEWAARKLLKLRPTVLLGGIRNLLGGDIVMTARLYWHPLVNSLTPVKAEDRNIDPAKADDAKKKELEGKLKQQLYQQPSYISARTFTLALLDTVAPASREGASQPQELDQIRQKVAAFPVDSIRDALLPLIDAAQGELDQARKNIEQWFEDAMDRVTGWYKRQSKRITLVLAILMAVVLNIDSVLIATTLYKDSALRTAVVEAAKKAEPPASTEEGKEAEQAKAILASLHLLNIPMGWVWNPENAVCPWWQAKPDQKTQKEPQDIKEKSKAPAPEDQKQEKPKPLDPRSVFGLGWWEWLCRVTGWFITILAISLGAPFWFDLLNKIVNLRGTGIKPEDKPKK